MEITIEALRKIDRLVQTLSEERALDLLGSIGLKEGLNPEDWVAHLDDHHNKDWGLADYKTLWGAAELANFFNAWVSPKKVTPQEINLRTARQKIKHDKLNNDNMIALEMNKDPHLLFLARTPNPYRALLDKTVTSEDIRDSVYWFPELGILLSKIHKDENGKLFTSILENQLVGEMEEFRLKSLVITKLFNNERYINELVVSADPQITGFDGMDQIHFVGPDVKKGLAGLYRRHDIRVNIHEIGPNIGADNRNLSLRVGSKMKVRSVKGVYELHILMYPDLYPNEKQIDYLKSELDEKGEVNLKKINDEWGYDEDKFNFQLNKQLENGKLRARIEGELLIRK